MDSAGPIVEGLVAEDSDEEELVVLVPARRCRFAMGGATSWHAFSSWEVTVGGSPPSLSTLLVGVFLSPLEVLEGPPPEAEEALEAVAPGVVCTSRDSGHNNSSEELDRKEVSCVSDALSQRVRSLPHRLGGSSCEGGYCGR